VRVTTHASTLATNVTTDLALAESIRYCATGEDRDLLLDSLTRVERPTVVAFVNAHACNLAAKDPAFARDLGAADVLLRDGTGMAVLCRRIGRDPGLNMNGTDLIPEMLERFRGRRVALFGTSDPWLSTAAETIGRSVEVVSAVDGFRDDSDYVAALHERPADLVVLAMGMPRQERVAARLVRESQGPLVVVCGGAVLDFVAGRVSRAPEWMRRFGIEWMWRLASEPRRLFKRYVIGNAVFLVRTRKAARTAGRAGTAG
jgi:N-acetylglucosaminyldiphosphoundecaprenol N-acetyl-beta-D-mannosaminyltransferase